MRTPTGRERRTAMQAASPINKNEFTFLTQQTLKSPVGNPSGQIKEKESSKLKDDDDDNDNGADNEEEIAQKQYFKSFFKGNSPKGTVKSSPSVEDANEENVNESSSEETPKIFESKSKDWLSV